MNRTGTKNKADFANSSEFHEELLILRAQELVAELIDESGEGKAALAKSLGQSKAHVTALLSGERNMTLRTLGRVCFHLGAEVTLKAESLREKVKDVPRYRTYRVSTTSMYLIADNDDREDMAA